MKFCEVTLDNSVTCNVHLNQTNTQQLDTNNNKGVFYVTGVSECARVLEMHPESVKRCILPYVDETDFAMKIQNTLIEAYCLENEISIVKTSSTEEITSALDGAKLEPTGLDCIIVCDNEVVLDSETDYPDMDSDDENWDWPS